MAGLEVLIVVPVFILAALLYYLFTRKQAVDELFVIPEKGKNLSKKDIRNQKKKMSKESKKKVVPVTNTNAKPSKTDAPAPVEKTEKILQLEIEPEVIEEEEQPVQIRNRKKKANKAFSGELKPILVNKDEHSPVVDSPIVYKHYKHIKDELEVKHVHDQQTVVDNSAADVNFKKNKKDKKKGKSSGTEHPVSEKNETTVPKTEIVVEAPVTSATKAAPEVKVGKGRKRRTVDQNEDNTVFNDRPSSPTRELLDTISKSTGVRIEGLITGLGGFSSLDISKFRQDNETLQNQLKVATQKAAEEVHKLKQENMHFVQEAQKAKLASQEAVQGLAAAQKEVARQKNLQTTYTLLQTEFQKKISEVKRVELDKNALIEKLKIAEGRTSTVDTDVRKLRSDLEDAMKTAENERRASKADRASLVELQKKYETLQKDFSAARQAGEGQEDPGTVAVPNSEGVDKLTKEVEEQKKKNNVLESQLTTKTQECERLSKDLLKEQSNMKEVESKLSETIEKLDRVEKEVSDLQQALGEKNLEIHELTEKLQSNTGLPAVSSNTEELEQLKAENQELTKTNWSMAEAVKVAEAQAEATATKFNEEQEKVVGLKLQLSKSQETLESTEKILQNLQTAVEEEEARWKNALTDSENECEEYKRALASAVAQLKQDRGVGADDVSDLNFAYRCVEKSLTNIVDEMENKLKEMEDKLKVVSQERDEAKAAQDRLSSELSGQVEKVGKLEGLIHNGPAVNNHVVEQGADSNSIRHNSESSDVSASNNNLQASTNHKSKESLSETPKKSKKKGFLKVFKSEKSK